VRKNLTGVLWLSQLYHQAQGYPESLRLLHLYKDFTTKTKEKTELIVLITPRVVENRWDSRAITREFKQKLRFVFPDVTSEPVQHPALIDSPS